MAEFEPAFNFTMDHEDRTRAGKITFDLGGRTRFGIAEKWHQNLPAEFWTAPPLEALAIAEGVYRDEYWRPIHGSEILDQRVASKCFDLYVNLRPQLAVGIFQNALRNLGQQIAADGHFGPATLASLNHTNPDQFLGEVVRLQKAHYEATARPQEKRGLINRAESIPA
jgi:lysozyme family protein